MDRKDVQQSILSVKGDGKWEPANAPVNDWQFHRPAV
jgi:hypothetical protein